MPKRKNPFGDTAPLQWKTHVGFKEAASEAEKQEVYARTKALLFEGAKHLSNGTNGCAVANGFLQHKTQSKLKDRSSPEMCKGCSQREANKLFVCSHCQRCVCGLECLKQCCVCAQSFCPYCSVLNYDEREVRSFCFDCLPVRS